MSDNCIRVIPEDPKYIPPEDCWNRALAYYHEIAPDAEKIEVIIDDTVQFRDCGTNFERVLCPSCSVEIDMVEWGEIMDTDYGLDGFTMEQHTLSCCGKQHTLQELKYKWPQGFSCFELKGMNPNLSKFTAKQRDEFSRHLKCAIRVIYQHM